ncbi:MAG: hypothetical protein U0166_08450 [Acidobacteriota bacterium]
MRGILIATIEGTEIRMHPRSSRRHRVAVAHQIWRHGSSGGAVLASAGLAVSVLHMELGRRVLLGRWCPRARSA